MYKNDREIAYAILSALCESSLVDELKYYKTDIQRDLLLSRDQMDRLYDLRNIAEALKPEPETVRYYKGRKVTDGQLPSFSFLRDVAESDPVAKDTIVSDPVVVDPIVVDPVVPDIIVPDPIVIDPVTPSTPEQVPADEDIVPATPPVDIAYTSMMGILTDIGINTSKVEIDTTKYTKFMIVYGLDDYKNYEISFSNMGGKYKPKFGGWVFTKNIVINYRKRMKDFETMETRKDSDEIDDPEKDEESD